MGVFPYTCDVCGGGYKRCCVGHCDTCAENEQDTINCNLTGHVKCIGGQFCFDPKAIIIINKSNYLPIDKKDKEKRDKTNQIDHKDVKLIKTDNPNVYSSKLLDTFTIGKYSLKWPDDCKDKSNKLVIECDYDEYGKFTSPDYYGFCFIGKDTPIENYDTEYMYMTRGPNNLKDHYLKINYENIVFAESVICKSCYR